MDSRNMGGHAYNKNISIMKWELFKECWLTYKEHRNRIKF